MLGYMAVRAVESAVREKEKQNVKQNVQEQPAEENEEVQDIIVPTNIEPHNLDKKQPELNPAKVLDHIDDVFRYWSRWQNVHERRIATLWVASTWFADKNGHLLFNAHPRLFFIDEKNSGKTQAMMIISSMARQSTGIVTDVTAPGLRDAIDAGDTVLLDEIDRKITSGRANTQVQSYIAAYKPGMTSLNGKEGGHNQRDSFGAMVLAAKPRIRLTTGGWIEDLFERSFILAPGRYENPNDHIPDMDEDFEYVTYGVSRVLKLWAAQARKNMLDKAYSDALMKYGLEPDPEKQSDEERILLARMMSKARFRPIHTVPNQLTARMRELATAMLVPADYGIDTIGDHPYRWAEWGREAVQNVLLGHGDDAEEIVSGLDRKFKDLGML